MRRAQRWLIFMAALVLSFGGLAVVAQAETGSAPVTVNSALKADNPGNQSGNVGITISPLQLTCSGGQPPCTWTATGLPAGLTVSSAGRISGTPTTAGTYNATVTARDTRNATSSAPFTWHLDNALTAFNPGDQTHTVGIAISPVQLRCFGGIPPCFFTVTGLPPGLVFGGIVQISGTPTTAGVYTVSYTVRDIRNVTASTSWTWTIEPR